MAGRVNTRFVIILVVVLTALVGGTAAAVLFFAQRDPTKYYAQGEKLEARAEAMKAGAQGSAGTDADAAEGEALPPKQQALRDAAEQYRLAYEYTDAADAELRKTILRKLAHIYGQYRVPDQDELQQWLSAVEQVWTRLLKIDATDREAREALLEISHKRAELAGNRVQPWNQLYNQADEAVDLVEEPAWVQRYRGLAQVARLANLQMRDPEAFEQARKDLDAAAAAFPDDPDVAHALGRLKLIEADAQAGLLGEMEVQALRDQSLTIIDQFVEAHPDNLEGRFARYQLLLHRFMIERGDRAWREKAMEALADLEQRSLESENAEIARRVAEQVTRMDSSIGEVGGERVRMGHHRAEQLLRHAVSIDPGNALALTSLGEILREQGRVADAIRFYEIAAEPGMMPVKVRSLLIGQLRLNAMRRLVGLYIDSAERAEGEASEAALAEARRWAEALHEEAGESSPLTQFAEGQLALAEGKNALAVRRLEAAAAQYDQPNADVLQALATALIRRGQHGEAATRLTQVLQTRQGRRQPGVYLQLASLHLRNGEPGKAMPLLERLLEVAPDNSRALALKAQALIMNADNAEARREARAEAIELLEPHVETGDRTLMLRYAQLLRQAGRTDEAVGLLEAYHADHPDDRGVLQMLVGMDLAAGRRDQAAERLSKATQANPEDQTLGALQLAVAEELTQEQRMAQAEALLSEEQDPIERHLSLYRLYQRTGQTEKAEAALETLEEAAPDNPVVKEVRLGEAIRNENWEQARQIIEWAKSANDGAGVDYAGGAFWEGRLLLAQGEGREAAAALRRGLEQMPSDSSGRLLLGMALVQTGDLAAAQRQIERSLEIKPDNRDAWVQLHRVQHELGDHEAALESLRSAIERSGGRAEARLLSRFIDYTGQFGDREVAINAREQLAEQQPGNAENRRKLAQLYFEADRVEDAHAVLDALLSDPPSDRENVATKAALLISQDRVDEARDLFEAFIHSSEVNAQNPVNWLAFARALSAGGEQGLAASTFRRAIELDDSPGKVALRQYADWLMSRQQYDDAAESYRRLLGSETLDESIAELVRRRYAEAVMRTGAFDEAKQQIDASIEQAPDDGQLYLLRAMNARSRAQQSDLDDDQRRRYIDRAERAVEQAVKLMPESSTAHLMWSQLHFDSQSEQTQRFVREHLERAIELNPRLTGAYELLVRWHRRQGDLASAIDVRESLVDARPESAEARVALADLYLSAGDMNARLDQLLDESEQLAPGQPAWPQLRSRMYQAQGRLGQALQAMRAAYERDASPGRSIELLDLMVRSGAHEQALALLDDRPELVRNSAVVQAMRGRAMCGVDRMDAGRNALRDAIGKAMGNAMAMRAVLRHVVPALSTEQTIALLEPMLDREASGQLGVALMGVMFTDEQHERVVDTGERIGSLAEESPSMEIQRLRLMALAHASLDQFEQAASLYHEILAIDKDDLSALNNLAFLLAEHMDDPQQALPLAERAAALVGPDAGAKANVLDTLGRVRFHLGDYREAAEVLRRSVTIRPMVENHLHLAELYRAMDRPNSARQQVNAARALVEETDDPEVRQRIESVARLLDGAASNAQEVNP